MADLTTRESSGPWLTSRAGAIIPLALGLGLSAFAWQSFSSTSRTAAGPALFGPMMLGIALGQLIHGRRAALLSFTWLYKAYALAGLGAGVAALYRLGLLTNTSTRDVIVFVMLIGLVLTARRSRLGAQATADSSASPPASLSNREHP